MTAFNVVRFKVKPGHEQAFVDLHRKLRLPFKGFLGGHLIKTGDRTFCMVAEWRTFQSIVNARPLMLGALDGFRGMLEDLGNGLGVTDPVSGQAVLKLGVPKAMKKPAKKTAVKKPAKKGGKKKAPVRKVAKRAPAKKRASKR